MPYRDGWRLWEQPHVQEEFFEGMRQQKRRSRLCLAVFGLTVLALVPLAFGLDHYMESVKASAAAEDRPSILQQQLDGVFTVLFDRPLGERLGFVLLRDENSDCPYFTELVEGGLAEASGKIQLFDQLVSINGDDPEDRAGVRTWIEGPQPYLRDQRHVRIEGRSGEWKTLEDAPETYGDATQVELKVFPRSSRFSQGAPKSLTTWEAVTCQSATCQALTAMLSAQLGGLLSLLQASSILFSCALAGLVAVAVLTQTHLVHRASALAWRLVVFGWKPASRACAAMVTRMRSAVSYAATARAEASANELLQQEEASSTRKERPAKPATERPAKPATASTRKHVVAETKAERRTAGECPCPSPHPRLRPCPCLCVFSRVHA